MENKKNKTKTNTIMRQISRPLIIFVVILMVTNALILFLYNMRNYIKQRHETTAMVAQMAVNEIEDYDGIGFLIPYWEDSYAEMDLVYDSDKLAEKEKAMYDAWGISKDIYRIDMTDIMDMSPEVQKLYAEVCYGRICEYMDTLKKVYKPLYLYAISIPKADNSTIFLVTGIYEEEKRISQGGELFELGTPQMYVKGAYPVLDELLATGKAPDQMELALRKSADRTAVQTFLPVYAGNEFVSVVGVAMEWTDMISAVSSVSLGLFFIQAIILGIIVLLTRNLVRKRVSSPLRRQQIAIENYEENKDSATTISELDKIDSDNEIGRLAKSFSSMVAELDRYVDEIRSVTAEKERIGAELSVAEKIQADMLPSVFPPFPDRHEFDIYAAMDPAKEVGGDFYDFFMLDDDHLGLVMADVSGKGVPAALFMVISKTLIKDQAGIIRSPKAILEKVNDMLCENNAENMFVTVWLGILEISTGKITAANAGHEYPAVKSAGGKYELLKDKHGIVMGLDTDMEYTEYEFTMEKGGALFVYTDGVPEATREDKEMFGNDRMIEALNEEPDADPEKLLVNVRCAVDDFVDTAPQFDDLTMMCLRYNGK